MTDIGVSVVQPGEGDTVAIPGFGAVFKLSGKNNNGEVSIVEHPFAVGFISAAHRHTREDEHSIVLAGEIGFRSDDSEVVLGPGGYITKPRATKYGLTYGTPDWLDGIVQRYGLNPPSH
jgi:quercetin dioxygenase-like cupin family protein